MSGLGNGLTLMGFHLLLSAMSRLHGAVFCISAMAREAKNVVSYRGVERGRGEARGSTVRVLCWGSLPSAVTCSHSGHALPGPRTEQNPGSGPRDDGDPWRQFYFK